MSDTLSGSTPAGSGANNHGPLDRTTLRILIIEDNVADARLIREMLTRAESVRGLSSTFVISEEQYLSSGLNTLAKGQVDLVLLDLSLPDAQGNDTFDRVRQQAHDVPVIVLTGATDEAMAIRAVQGGAQDFLVKGKIDGELLWQAVHYAIERHSVQQEKLRLDARLRETTRWESLAMMAGGIAHDYNNLLTIILGNVEAVLDGSPNAAFSRSALLDAHRATLRAAELTEHVLAYAGGSRVARRPLLLTRILQDAIEAMRGQLAPNITLRTELSPNLPYVAADQELLQQVVTSLITNAAESIGDRPGEIVVTTGTTVAEAPGETPPASSGDVPEGPYVYIDVADNGSGMDEATRGRCFDPFFTTKFTGRGLGLASAFGIIRAHRGTLNVDSTLGGGSVFRIRLPRQERPLTLVERPLATLSPIPIKSKLTRSKTLKAPKILVVEDDADLLRLTKWILENSGFGVLTARDGAEGVEVFTRHSEEVALVLLDVTMPRVDGRQALREILLKKPDARVILCSGYSKEDVFQGIEDQGSFAFLRKPYTRVQLTQIIQSVLNQ